MKKLSFLIIMALLPVVASAYDACIDGIYYNFSGDEAEVTYSRPRGNGYSGDIVIPETITYEGNSYRVTSIGSQGFAYCYEVTSVTIPNGLLSIGDNAFYKCLTLQSVNIPEGITDIGKTAFWYCESLTSITIPGSVKSIGKAAFKDCESLTSITLSNGVTTIGEEAFKECTSLCSINIPESVTSIGGSAFLDCMELTELTLPNSLTSIGDLAFANNKLANVYCYSEEVPNAGIGSFSSNNYVSVVLHVPAGSVEKYRATYPWSEFRNIVAMTEPESVTYTTDQMATIILPTVPDASKGKYYKLDRREDGQIIFIQETQPQARTPYIIVPNEDFSIDMSTLDVAGLSPDTVTVGGISFIGSYVRTELPALTGGDGGGSSSSYYDIIDTTPDCLIAQISTEMSVVGALRAYLVVTWDDPIHQGPTKGEPEKLEIVLLDEGTGISDAERLNDKGQMINDKWYNLSGQRLRKMQRGVNIVKGKKILVK